MAWVRFLGKFLISAGLGVLLFVGWTLYGTGFYTQRQQDRLAVEFDQLPEVEVTTQEPGRPPPGYDPGPGEPVFRMRIPAIDLNHIVVEGVGVDELRLGPGHYPECSPAFAPPLCTPFKEVWPGEKGRVIVSGHRTTYGQPFWDLDKLRPGDQIQVETKWGEFNYSVRASEVVPAGSKAIVVESDRAEIVLTTCNPKFSAAERLIVYASLESS